MYKKLSNQEWAEQIKEYYNRKTSITTSKFCEYNNLINLNKTELKHGFTEAKLCKE